MIWLVPGPCENALSTTHGPFGSENRTDPSSINEMVTLTFGPSATAFAMRCLMYVTSLPASARTAPVSDRQLTRPAPAGGSRRRASSRLPPPPPLGPFRLCGAAAVDQVATVTRHRHVA